MPTQSNHYKNKPKKTKRKQPTFEDEDDSDDSKPLIRLPPPTPPKKPLNLHLIYLTSIVDIIIFAVSIYLNKGFEPFSVNPMFGPSADVLLELGANYDQKILDGQWWRFITPMFLHAGLIHLAFNLMFQIQQGVPLERDFGSIRIFIIYILSGIAGNLMSSIFLPTTLSVGASGSLFGLLGITLAVIIKSWSDLSHPCKSMIFLSLAICFNLFIGLLPYVDNFAHVGGLIAGTLFGFAIMPGKERSFVNSVLTAFGFAAGVVTLAAGFFLFYTEFDVHDWCTWCRYINCLPVDGWCNSYNQQ